MTAAIEDLKSKFRQYDIVLIGEFIKLFLMPALPNNNDKVFNVRSSDGKTTSVWGPSAEAVLQQFNRFLNLRIYL